MTLIEKFVCWGLRMIWLKLVVYLSITFVSNNWLASFQAMFINLPCYFQVYTISMLKEICVVIRIIVIRYGNGEPIEVSIIFQVEKLLIVYLAPVMPSAKSNTHFCIEVILKR